ncbi:MAG: flotillin family protein [Verrucomicrobiales bacterium]|jgi:flotillin|nr:flotillin family protein [Verrucomicrobiales bacterium]
MSFAIAIIAVALLFFVTMLSLLKCYKKCPSDRILVIYGKVAGGRGARCIHGGGSFVWPVIQGFQYMDLRPVSVEVNLEDALSLQKIRVDVPSTFMIGLSTEPEIMQNAAERLLGLTLPQIMSSALDIITGQMRQVIASLSIEEINADRDKLLVSVRDSISVELEKIGLRLINVNIRDITDDVGYIDSLGKEVAAERINTANIRVAEADRDGAVGAARARKEQAVTVAALQAETRQGENASLVAIADSDATRRSREAGARKLAETAEQVAVAETAKNSALAKQEAEMARARVTEATYEADVLVPARQTKSQQVIQAEADAAVRVKIAEGAADAVRKNKQGEADGLLAVKTAEADGLRQLRLAEADGIKAALNGRAEGFERLTKAAGANPALAINLLLVEQMPVLVGAQTEAIKNIKFDKVVVWDNGGANGGTSTANFLNKLATALPPLHELLNNVGLKLPSVLGTPAADAEPAPPAPAPSAPPTGGQQ